MFLPRPTEVKCWPRSRKITVDLLREVCVAEVLVLCDWLEDLAAVSKAVTRG